MQTVSLKRVTSSDQGTFGFLIFNSFSCRSLELPWKLNYPGLSCIPEGNYFCHWTLSPRLKKECYEVLAVPQREGIRIHSANLATQLEGCIALGDSIGELGGFKAILNSRDTVHKFEEMMKHEPFQLEIGNVAHI